MDRKLIGQANFREICKILKDEKYELHDCMKGLFHVALLFFPELISKETAFITNIANGVTLLDAVTEIENAIKTLFHTFNKKSYEDFTTKYEHAQIAQVLIVFAAYFDSMKMYLPNEEKAIRLSKHEKIILTEESIAKYVSLLESKSKEAEATHAKYIFEYDLSIPNPLESSEQYLGNLRRFYDTLNEEFLYFYQKLSFWEELDALQRNQFREALRHLPDKAVENYQKQYYQLAVTFQDFFVWTNMQQHERLARKIDIGFAELTRQLVTYQEKALQSTALSTVQKYRKKYQDWIDGAVIDTPEMQHDSTEDVVFPAKKDIFVPQRFQSLLYKNNAQLESPETWADCEKKQDIGKFISDILRHPATGSLPLLILGHPGAGKSLLCHMLAARILFHEYHVIILRLRDTIADQKIRQQIDQQIERDFTNGCTWDTIAESGLQKPLLIIFDGYDELLQASGKTYSNYLQEIAEFQREEKTYRGMLVKCIITSRITLIDKAVITDRTPVIMLSDFDQSEIDVWSRIWNDHNAAYFAENRLEPFTIEQRDKISALARQPLLLLMLALFDSNDNALRKNKDLNSTQLYDKLIREFIAREKRKSNAFKNKQHREQMKILELELKKISIAALGMYNRKALYIRGEDLENDLHFILQKEALFSELHDDELSESDKLLGSFFFIHRSDATDLINKEKRHSSAYEFLHNTFGEFLTAHYIVDETYQILNWIQILLQGHQEHQWNPENQKSWFVCLSYAPLFLRPVVVEMIHEWSDSYFDDRQLSSKKLTKAFDFLMDSEMRRVLRGDAIFTLKRVAEEKENPYQQDEILKHLATYTLNLIILKTIICQSEYTFPFGQDAWNKLLSLWKYAFSEDELLNYSDLFCTTMENDAYYISYIGTRGSSHADQSRVKRLSSISFALGDEVMSGLIDSLSGTSYLIDMIGVLERNNLPIKARFCWNYLLAALTDQEFSQKDLLVMLSEFYQFCLEEKDTSCLFSFYLLLHFLLKTEILKMEETVNDFLIRCIIDGITLLTNEDNDYIIPIRSKKAISIDINLLAIHLLDYTKLHKKTLIDICRTSLYYSKKPNQLYTQYYDGCLQLQILKTITVNPINRCTLKDSFAQIYTNEYLKELNNIIYRLHTHSKGIVFNYFEIAYYLLLSEEYRIGFVIFKYCMQALEATDFKDTDQMTISQKIPVIDALYLMYQRNLFTQTETGRISENIIREVDIQKIYVVSPETVGHLLFLLGLRTFMNPLKVRDGLISIIRNKWDSIPIGVYRQIYLYAQKIDFPELIDLLDKMMQI